MLTKGRKILLGILVENGGTLSCPGGIAVSKALKPHLPPGYSPSPAATISLVKGMERDGFVDFVVNGRIPVSISLTENGWNFARLRGISTNTPSREVHQSPIPNKSDEGFPKAAESLTEAVEQDLTVRQPDFDPKEVAAHLLNAVVDLLSKPEDKELSANLSKLHIHVDSLKRENRTLMSKVSCLEGEVASLKRRNDALKSRCERYELEIRRSGSENERIIDARVKDKIAKFMGEKPRG